MAGSTSIRQEVGARAAVLALHVVGLDREHVARPPQKSRSMSNGVAKRRFSSATTGASASRTSMLTAGDRTVDVRVRREEVAAGSAAVHGQAQQVRTEGLFDLSGRRDLTLEPIVGARLGSSVDSDELEQSAVRRGGLTARVASLGARRVAIAAETGPPPAPSQASRGSPGPPRDAQAGGRFSTP
jgi:hypothetical protein